jgi:hypothetical protein
MHKIAPRIRDDLENKSEGKSEDDSEDESEAPVACPSKQAPGILPSQSQPSLSLSIPRSCPSAI